ncbi:YceI family protein [Bowmanella dokdonensis]|uniref:YceI family protein n=1 Tax=Bowmanella dokdonensis TaxID=751969 RepID=A0A939DJ30_9ALTE|nr:YceI family protein [Bowmanella dokdonensis]MBN7823639.1 YceI family protein [Bowmanella dokdonensis]
MRIISLAALLLCAHTALADWQLDQQASSLHFLSTKNNLVTEIHHFKQFDGSLSDSGALKVSIDIMSLETGIPIRNERMQEHLFKLFPKANLSAQLPDKVLELDVGETTRLEVKAKLDMATKTQTLPIDVQITRLANEQLVATTTKPILINAIQFGLTDGIKKLQEIAGLSSIDQTIPVTFSVVFSDNQS